MRSTRQVTKRPTRGFRVGEMVGTWKPWADGAPLGGRSLIQPWRKRPAKRLSRIGRARVRHCAIRSGSRFPASRLSGAVVPRLVVLLPIDGPSLAREPLARAAQGLVGLDLGLLGILQHQPHAPVRAARIVRGSRLKGKISAFVGHAIPPWPGKALSSEACLGRRLPMRHRPAMLDLRSRGFEGKLNLHPRKMPCKIRIVE